MSTMPTGMPRKNHQNPLKMAAAPAATMATNAQADATKAMRSAFGSRNPRFSPSFSTLFFQVWKPLANDVRWVLAISLSSLSTSSLPSAIWWKRNLQSCRS